MEEWKLGDQLHEALATFGITPQRVSRFLGVPCDCKFRQARLNALSAWAQRVVAGKPRDQAQSELDRIFKGKL